MRCLRPPRSATAVRRQLFSGDAVHLPSPPRQPLQARRPPCRRCFSQTSRRQRPQQTTPPPLPSGSGHDGLAPRRTVIFSGIQPTGIPHLGNYLGALQRWVQLQGEAGAAAAAAAACPPTQLYYSVVDLHALTSVSAPHDAAAAAAAAAGSSSNSGGAVLRERRRAMLAMLLAIGLDPDRCVLFYQSAVPAHAELMWLLSCTASVGYLSRMTQWKSKLHLRDDASLRDDGARAALKLGLFSYPVLQAADVLVHRATHVPVGADQSQHLEFARECAIGFNHAHGYGRGGAGADGAGLLIPPTTLLSPARRVMSLQQPVEKMSKSHADARSRILLTDDAATIRAKIFAARTDSTNAVSYDRAARPGVANLLEILALMDDDTTVAAADAKAGSVFRADGAAAGEDDALAARVAAHAAALDGQPLRVLKERVAEAVVARLAGIRERFHDVLARDDGAYLDRVAEHGAKKARANAAETMDVVRAAIGL